MTLAGPISADDRGGHDRGRQQLAEVAQPLDAGRRIGAEPPPVRSPPADQDAEDQGLDDDADRGCDRDAGRDAGQDVDRPGEHHEADRVDRDPPLPPGHRQPRGGDAGGRPDQRDGAPRHDRLAADVGRQDEVRRERAEVEKADPGAPPTPLMPGPLRLQCSSGRGAQVVGVERLGDPLVAGALDPVDDLAGPLHGHEDRGDVGPEAVELGEEVDAVGVGERVVHQHQVGQVVGLVGVQRSQPPAVGDAADLVTVLEHAVRDPVAHVDVVLHDQHPRHGPTLEHLSVIRPCA